MKKIPVRFYGLLRRCFEQGPAELQLEIPETGSFTTADARRKISELLAAHCQTTSKPNPARVLDECAIADERRVLDDAAEVLGCRELSVLPPVCGG